MSRFDRGWRDSLRLNHGLGWAKSRPTFEDYAYMIANWLLAIVCVAALLLLMGFLDARDAAIAAEIESEKSSAMFASFLNGGSLVAEDQSFAVRCGSIIEVTN